MVQSSNTTLLGFPQWTPIDNVYVRVLISMELQVICFCACMHACGGQKSTLGVFLGHDSYCLRQGMSLTLELTELADWLANGLQESANLHPPPSALGTEVCCCAWVFVFVFVFTWELGIGTRVLMSALFKHCTCRSTFPVHSDWPLRLIPPPM